MIFFTEPPTYLDGGLKYLARKLKKENVAPIAPTTTSRSKILERIKIPKSDLKYIPVSNVDNAPAPEMTAYKSVSLKVLTSNTVVNTYTSPEPEIKETSTTEITPEFEYSSPNKLNVLLKRPAVVSTTVPSFDDAFPISKELPVAVTKTRQRYPEIVYAVPFVEQETTSITSTTTTTIPTTEVRTEPPTTTSSPGCVHGEIYPTDTGSCDQFLMCYKSVVVLLICPQDMGFNFETKRCDWAQYVPACNQGNLQYTK